MIECMSIIVWCFLSLRIVATYMHVDGIMNVLLAFEIQINVQVCILSSYAMVKKCIQFRPVCEFSYLEFWGKPILTSKMYQIIQRVHVFY